MHELEGGDNECDLPSRTPDDPIDDEAFEAGIVSDPDCVLADVKLATTVRKARLFLSKLSVSDSMVRS